MKSSKVKVCAMALVLSLLMSACGEKQIILTEGEEAAIVNYAAHVISKFNTRQPDGLAYVPPAEYEEETADVTEPETEAAEELETEHISDTSEGVTDAAERPKTDEVPQTTLTEALGVPGISAEFTGAELLATYKQEDYYAVDASAGNQFLVVNIKLVNTGEGEVNVDMLSDRPSFQVKVNGSVSAAAQTTILLNDLSTYQGTIGAGEAVDTVLLFQVPTDQVTSVDSIELKLSVNGSNHTITL